MKKNGFVFIESVVVLVVVALSLTMLIASYSLVSRKTKEKEDYNRTSDKYLIYNISTLGTNDLCNYSSECSICTYSEACKTVIDIELGVDDECTNNTSCQKVSTIIPKWRDIFEDYNIENIYVVSNIRAVLNGNTAIQKYDNGAIEYMKTLKKCRTENKDAEGNYVNKNTSNSECTDPIKYMIGVFKRDGKYYYASIEI